MRVTVESATKIVQLNGIPARIWQGTTESGIPVHCYITRIAVDRNEDCSQFERELREQSAPRSELEAIPMRLVL